MRNDRNLDWGHKNTSGDTFWFAGIYFLVHTIFVASKLWICKLPYMFKGIHWQLDKLGLKVVFCLDKNDGESHFAELGSSWPGEAKTWPKIALRVGGRAENSVLGDGRAK